MKSFTRFVGRLPFSGKLLIRQFVFGLYRSTTKTERRRKYLSLVILLSIYVPVHVLQAVLGIQALDFNAPIWVKVFMSLYALINISVVLVQISLGFRATKFCFRGLYSQTKKKYNHVLSTSERRTIQLVTGGGQITFVVLYALYYR
jgi:hypothetical protein